RELAEYDEVDVLSIPSRHVEAGFLAKGFAPHRLARNVLGVDLDEFPHSQGPGAGPLEVVFVGAFSRRKGCDLWLEAAARMPTIRFTHVGPAGDVAPATLDNVSHIPAVPQHELHRFYALADVLTLPSREDGFGLVMSQALASGCHVVGTDKTGAPDLSELTGDAVTVLPAGDLEALIAHLAALDARRQALRADRRSKAHWREALSWRAYAERYLAMLEERLSARRRPGRASS
ncbi:MAG TPA: glycosyltransferase, partial [Myxococcota bacterium]|nr:glycosyltransferase [Myxococcota bacterium]